MALRWDRLSHSFAAAAGSNSIGKPSEKSQGDHAEAVNTLTARVTAVFHIKELESSKEGWGAGGMHKFISNNDFNTGADIF